MDWLDVLSQIGTVEDRKRHGRHYTPTTLAAFLAERTVAALPASRESYAILDPACGDGELLFEACAALRTERPDATFTLLGYDIDSEAIAIARQRAKVLGIEAEFRTEDFLLASETLADSAFDAIITNPPYVRTQQLGAATSKLLAEKYNLNGRIDLTHPFVSVAPRLLSVGGVLGLLCSNRFLTTKAGSNVRSVLARDLALVELFDLGDSKLFNAAVLPAIVIGTRPGSMNAIPKVCTFVSTYEVEGLGEEGLDYFEALMCHRSGIASIDRRTFQVNVGTLVRGDVASQPWRMGGTGEEAWFDRIDHGTWKTFGDIAKIRVGIKTTADAVFIGDHWAAMDFADAPEPELLLPLTTHRNTAPWNFLNAGSFAVLYPYELDIEKRTVVDMKLYPRAMAYLEGHRERLAGRKYVIEGGREWFEIWVPQKPALWKLPKIVFPDISEQPRFAFDRAGAVVNGDCYWMSLADIQDEELALLMVGVANSALAVRFYDHVCGNKLYSGRRRWISQYVSRFPVPDPTAPESRQVVGIVAALVEEQRQPTPEEVKLMDDLIERAFGAHSDVVADGRLF